MKRFILISSIILGLFITSCNYTHDYGTDGNTPFSTVPTHIEFWNGGTKIAEYDNAIVRVCATENGSLGTSITWYYYEVFVNGTVVDTIIDSEALCIKYQGARIR